MELIQDRYQVETLLGRGGIGDTFRAIDQKTGQKVALKQVSLKETTWKSIELFEREAKVLQQIDHPGIPKYIDAFYVDEVTNRTYYIVQTLAAGESLQSLVEGGWRTTEVEVKAIAAQILHILRYLHQQDPPIIHRDIKPDNLIYNRDDCRVSLVDFGAVQNAYYSTVAHSSTVAGTFGYMAPEQFQGRAVAASDLYGLGATLLFLLTHRSPAELPMQGLRLNFRQQVSISLDFADWLETLLEPDIGDRVAAADEALSMLNQRQSLKSFSALSWRPLAVIGITFVAIAIGLANLYPHRWRVIGWSGLQPTQELCRQTRYLRQYLAGGGNPSVHINLDPLLTCALKAENSEGAALLIAHGADVDPSIRRVDGDTRDDYAPLIAAIENGDVEITTQILEGGVNPQDFMGETTPLSQLLKDRDQRNVVPLMTLLLEHGAEPSSDDYAAAMKHASATAIAPVLVEFGVDPELLLHRGALMHQNPMVMADFFLQQGIAPQRLLEAVSLYSPNIDLIDKLLEAEAVPEDPERLGHFLHAAIEENRLDLVQRFIAEGADVNFVNIGELTPLHQSLIGLANDARAEIAPELVDLLLQQGADPNATSGLGTPLHQLASHGEIDIARQLIEAGANVNHIAAEGQTALHIAAKRGHVSFVELLLAAGADPNQENDEAHKPLHEASQRSNIEVIKILKPVTDQEADS
ncbi:MAG: ankyrin repeat domain-containing protein [Cyanobacteria bacterium P01_D01_bin.6]